MKPPPNSRARKPSGTWTGEFGAALMAPILAALAGLDERRLDPRVAVAVDGVEQAERVAVLREELAPQVEEGLAERGAVEEALEEALRPFDREQGRRLALGADDAARALGHEVGDEAVV